MFKCINGLTLNFLCNDVTMHVDIHGYDTRKNENVDLYIPRVRSALPWRHNEHDSVSNHPRYDC